MRTLIQLLIVVFCLLGIADAGYISYEKFSGIVPPCSPPFKCDEVLSSSWATIAGVPVSVFGVLFYSVFLITNIALYLGKVEISLGKWRLPLIRLLGLYGLFGIGFSLYLVYIMGVVLEAWCVFCLLSAANCVILFLLSAALNLTQSKIEPSES